MATKVAKVGRPKGVVHKVSDMQRIRNVLEQFGVTQTTEEVRKNLCRKGGALATRFRNDKALSVKVAQAKRKLIGDATGVVRATKGRMTKVERELVDAKLEIQALQAQIAALQTPAVEAPEAVPEAVPAVEASPAPEAAAVANLEVPEAA